MEPTKNVLSSIQQSLAPTEQDDKGKDCTEKQRVPSLPLSQIHGTQVSEVQEPKKISPSPHPLNNLVRAARKQLGLSLQELPEEMNEYALNYEKNEGQPFSLDKAFVDEMNQALPLFIIIKEQTHVAGVTHILLPYVIEDMHKPKLTEFLDTLHYGFQRNMIITIDLYAPILEEMSAEIFDLLIQKLCPIIKKFCVSGS